MELMLYTCEWEWCELALICLWHESVIIPTQFSPIPCFDSHCTSIVRLKREFARGLLVACHFTIQLFTGTSFQRCNKRRKAGLIGLQVVIASVLTSSRVRLLLHLLSFIASHYPIKATLHLLLHASHATLPPSNAPINTDKNTRTHGMDLPKDYPVFTVWESLSKICCLYNIDRYKWWWRHVVGCSILCHDQWSAMSHANNISHTPALFLVTQALSLICSPLIYELFSIFSSVWNITT